MSKSQVRLPDVRRLLKNAAVLELSAGAMQRLKWFLYALEHENNVSLTCRHFGIARSTFLRWWKRFDPQDIATLEEESRRPNTVRKPETDAHTVELIRQLRMENPAMGKVGIHALLQSAYGIDVSVSTVGRVIARHKLFFADSTSHMQKRGETTEEFLTTTESKPSSTSAPATLPPANADEGELPMLPAPSSPTA